MFLQAYGRSTGPAHPECASLKSIKAAGMLGSGCRRRERAAPCELGAVERTSSVLLKRKVVKTHMWLCPQTVETSQKEQRKKLPNALEPQTPPQEPAALLRVREERSGSSLLPEGGRHGGLSVWENLSRPQCLGKHMSAAAGPVSAGPYRPPDEVSPGPSDSWTAQQLGRIKAGGTATGILFPLNSNQSPSRLTKFQS